ncbi:MAG: acyl-CoA thioesterase II [Phenylobacterium sp.]|jgi:acyl-CoA thioesterase-2|uniref:acyl-CoA thioesterase II n=1 Tax=Phenylobacterium sp. TaxID=1871053 RepID=UPI002A27EA77|nr:acyl-CoA thioesterase II [Phenylobacterium sp.]MDD3837296.1 acyl-CoA thioesterase II [Phenylobacterium sp.]MDX9996961.1 acyl-CoA thioesterase II [Phenylobacterium sp.]
MDLTESLVETLALERIEVNLFRGTSPNEGPGRIFGGQVIAQSLLAAYETVENRVCHSLHCYFIRPGDPTIPILFDVDRARDGGSFTTRRVVAIQRGQQIFNLAASFQDVEDGYEHQFPMPKAPGPDEMDDELTAQKKQLEKMPEAMRKMISRPRPIEMRGRDSFGWTPAENVEPTSNVWIRAREPIGDDLRMHQVILAYASDMNLLSTAMRPHKVGWQTPGLQSASLDHAMWFHKPSNFNDWHLYAQDSPSASGGRGFVRGSIYDQAGNLVASVAQEGLMRQRKPKAEG